MHPNANKSFVAFTYRFNKLKYKEMKDINARQLVSNKEKVWNKVSKEKVSWLGFVGW